MKKFIQSFACVMSLLVMATSASAVPTFIGGTVINAPQAEGCCAGSSLFNFNGGNGDLSLEDGNTQQVGLDSRSGDGVYNGQTNVPATFFIAGGAGQGSLTGFQVMNSTNGQFDDRQTGQFTIDVSTNGGGSFTNVLNTTLNTVALDNGNAAPDFAAPNAQQFNIAPITLSPDATFNVIRINSVTQVGNAGVSLSEFRSIIDDGGFLPPPPPAPAGEWNSFTFTPASGNLNNLADADNAIATGNLVGSGLVNSVNYLNNAGGNGNFGGDVNPFGVALNSDDFAVLSTGFLQVGTNGNYQFRNNTDDGSRLRIDLNMDGVFGAGETVILDDVLSGPHNADSSVLALLSGEYMIEHVWFERGGGAEGDLGVSFNGGEFLLLGNPQNDGAFAFRASGTFVTAESLVPEPASALLGLIGLGALGLRRRRAA